MGIARIWRPENNSDTSGTPGYMGKNSKRFKIKKKTKIKIQNKYSSRGYVQTKSWSCC